MRPRVGIAVIGLTRSMRLTAMRSAVVVAVILGLSSGCATIRRHSTLETEQMLSAAGFHMKLADTPEKLAHLQTLTQRRLVPHRQADWTCPGLVDTWVKLPPRPVRAVARTLAD